MEDIAEIALPAPFFLGQISKEDNGFEILPGMMLCGIFANGRMIVRAS